MTDYGSVGELITERMRQRNLTQQQVAEQAGMAQTSVSRIKLIRDPYYLPTLEARLKLGPVLGISDEEWLRAAHQFADPEACVESDPRDELMRMREQVSRWQDIDPRVVETFLADIDWALTRLSSRH